MTKKSLSLKLEVTTGRRDDEEELELELEAATTGKMRRDDCELVGSSILPLKSLGLRFGDSSI